MNFVPEHERLFDEICSKLSELSHKSEKGLDMNSESGALERMQGQIRRFHDDLQGSQDELRDKIKNLENVHYKQSDMTVQLKALSEQLADERQINTKLNADLAKSLELSLQLQLEIQGLKARTQQSQNEEKKYNQSLMEKMRSLQTEIDLQKALKDESDEQLAKAKTSFQRQQESWQQEAQALIKQNEEQNKHIQLQNTEIEKMSAGFEGLESSAHKQSEVLKNLMEAAEGKIVEIKMALDRKEFECQDYYNHLQQSLTQGSLLKSENANLKEHIEKLNQLLQQNQST